MSDVRPGPVGPWGAVGDVPRRPAAARRRADRNETPGQNLIWALVSTALLAGLLWWLMGWVYALAGIVGLLVHEYGHVLAMNRLGMGPARIYIIPFLGGAARGACGAASEWIGVLVSLAGPAFGLIAALPFFAVWAATGDPVWLQGAWFVAVINLLNLAPAPPLDGSRALGPVLARIHPLLEKAALLGVGALVVLWGLQNGAYVLAVFLALGVISHLRRGAWRPDAVPLSWRQAGASLGLFLATGAACAAVGLTAMAFYTGDGLGAALTASGRFLGLAA
ncbi:MAG: site-2 protease family protein [Brevundimonas sp.]